MSQFLESRYPWMFLLKQKILSFDLFRVNINMTYRKKPEFATICGSCASIFLLVSVSVLAVIEIYS